MIARYAIQPVSARDGTACVIDARTREPLSGEFPEATAAEIAAALTRAFDAGRASREEVKPA